MRQQFEALLQIEQYLLSYSYPNISQSNRLLNKISQSNAKQSKIFFFVLAYKTYVNSLIGSITEIIKNIKNQIVRAFDFYIN